MGLTIRNLSLAELHELAAPLGFGLVGVTPAEPSRYAAAVRDWLGRGLHGEMGYLAEHLDKRLDPRALVPGAASVICVADFYHTPANEARKPPVPEPAGRIARYAWGDDYHKVMKKRLFALADRLRERFADEEFKVTVDTAPLLEREYAGRAGLGWVGKHTLVIHPRFGSYMLLGEIVTTLAIESSDEAGHPGALTPGTDHCGTCTRCIDACPTQCIDPQGYAIDGSRCISYLTIEHRSPIDASLHDAMGDWIAGCDVCQEVCPHNRERAEIRNTNAELEMPEVRQEYAPRTTALPLLDVLNWSAEARQEALTRSALKRIKLEMFKRNALIAAGNYLREHDDAALRRRIADLADDADEHEMVRVTARQVLSRLEGQGESGGETGPGMRPAR